jgi:L-asparaginase
MNLRIINTGGTFNKRYDAKSGKLVVPKDNRAIETIVHQIYRGNTPPPIDGLLHKDSLEIDASDRERLLEHIRSVREEQVLIVHGTDTMHESAAHLAPHITDRAIVFCGAMQPFSIDPIEATGNLMAALGFLWAKPKPGIYVAMNGLIDTYTHIVKNRAESVFTSLRYSPI